MPGADDSSPRLLRARAPLRVSFAGGGTDVAPYPAEKGGLVLSATINRYAYGTLRTRQDRQIGIQSLDLDAVASFALEEARPGGDRLDLILAAIDKLASDSEQGFDLFLHSAAPPGSGLGSSSAVVVALVGLLSDHMRMPLTDYEKARLAYTVEREDLGLKGGAQDQYAAVFGGFNFIEFRADDVIVNPLRIAAESILELEYNLLLCFTGRTRVGDHIIDDQTDRYRSQASSTVDGLEMQKELAVEMKDALLRGNLTEFGELLGRAWEYKKQMSPKISNPHIDELYEEAIKHGAIGGKVTGAGGGGYMLLYCKYDAKHEVRAALAALGAEAVDFQFDHVGLTTWSHARD
ncbi:MAG: GHMP kinase [Solirubrobacterales bacterium]|nr:GHMP kinase [Solirubrobacterales bacterium]